MTKKFAGKAALAVLLAVAAIAAAPLVMGPSYEVLQPRLGPMTLIVVEVLYALFIDFPLTALYVGLLSLWFGPRRNPARSALAFVATFFGLIGACIALAPASDLLAWLALSDTFPVAVAEAVRGMGAGAVGLQLAGFVAFDLLLCATGGVVAGLLVEQRSAPSLKN